MVDHFFSKEVLRLLIITQLLLGITIAQLTSQPLTTCSADQLWSGDQGVVVCDRAYTNITDGDALKIILVHGTFARSASWYQPGGVFFEALMAWSAGAGVPITIEAFKWTGALSALKRMEAATQLAQLLFYQCQTVNERIILIGHSHGANVIMLATQLLAVLQQPKTNIDVKTKALGQMVDACLDREQQFLQELKCSAVRSMADAQDFLMQDLQFDLELSEQNLVTSKAQILTQLCTLLETTRCITTADVLQDKEPVPAISAVYALGAPIDPTVYWPAESVVANLYSIYSEGDNVQIYSSQFKRRFADFTTFKPQSCRVVDIKLTFGERAGAKSLEHPRHLQLNNAVVGRWLLEVPQLTNPAATSGIKSTNNCGWAWVHFFKDLSRPLAKRA